MSLILSPRTQQVLGHPRPGHVIVITPIRTVGTTEGAITAEWCPISRAENDLDVVRLSTTSSAQPIYVEQALAEYLRWQPLELVAQQFGPWCLLSVPHAEAAYRSLQRWLYLHRGIMHPVALAAA